MALQVDLQRCRRMVATMRSLVMASSLRLQLLEDARTALLARDERLQKRLAGGAAPASPRARYLGDYRDERIRVIQRRWRRHRWERLVLEKIKSERKWRARRGNKRLERSATTIQRVFRGFRVRRRRREATRPSLLATIVHSQVQRRRAERLQFHQRIDSALAALTKARRNLETAQLGKATTEQQLASASASSSASKSAKAAAALFVDATLLDGTVVRMEVHQLLVHQLREIERLVATIDELQRQLDVMHQGDPVVHQAAARIQSLFRGHLVHQAQQRKLRQRRLARVRLRLSSERCFERMNVGFLARQHAQWHRCAAVLAGLHHIVVAKRLLHLHRQRRAVATIERVYRKKRERVDAHARVAGRRAKLRAQLFRLRRAHRDTARVWCEWRGGVARERQRRVRIAQALADGETACVAASARRLQRLFRRALAERRRLLEETVPVLHPLLLHALDAAAAGSCDDLPRDQFVRFYQRVVLDVHAWRTPSRHVYALARRYALSLDTLEVDGLWTWLLNQQQQQQTAGSSRAWFLDVRRPFPARTLRFLAHVSRFYDAHDRVQRQCDAIAVHGEAVHAVRAYLALLFAHDAVCFASATTFSAQQRHRAVDFLQAQNAHEREENAEGGGDRKGRGRQGEAFTTFHSTWTDLCERCLALESDRLARACASCGHRRVESSTTAQASHAAVASPVAAPADAASSTRWVRASERCDVLVIHAFFHALAPRGHVHRELYAPATLWKIALAKALEPVTSLYEAFHIRTLDELLEAHATDKRARWEALLPAPVATRLLLFLGLLKQELAAVQRDASARR